MTRYVVIGCGGVGGLYGARLAAAGHDVGFVVRSDVHALRTGGLRLDSVDGDVVLPAGSFQVTDDPDELGVADVVIVALKTTANDALDRVLPPLVGPATVVAAFQNGLGVEDRIADVVPDAAGIVGGMCFVCSARIAPGHIDHVDYGAVTLGVHCGSMGSVADDMVDAGIDTVVAEDLTTARWTKLLWNIPFNGLTALLGVGTDVLLADPAGRSLAEALMAETVAAARACGAKMPDDATADMMDRTEKMVPYRSSMALDRDAGRPLEVEAIYAAPVAAATAAGVDVPRIAQLRDLLRIISP